jgi:UPF0755 protein
MIRRRVGCALTTVTVLLLGIAIVSGWFQVSVFNRREHTAADKIVSIEPGLGTRGIVARLVDEGVIGDGTALLLWLTVTGQGRQLKAGDYQFESPISPYEVAEKIRKGDVATRRVTIPEGKNRFQVADMLAERTGLATREEFLRVMASPELIRDIDPDASSLEGYLFPDTYEYAPKAKPAELVKEMVDRFREVYKPEWAAKAQTHSLTIHQAMTLASIVEGEAKVDEERPLIASVFYNRLEKGMKLESDPTFIYAAILANDYEGNVNNPKHRRRLDPYNTYQFPGLPPGPILNPGLKSIEAVLDPADTNFVFFVVNGTDGRHKFSRTPEEHEAAVQEYRRLQQQQQQQNGSGSR